MIGALIGVAGMALLVAATAALAGPWWAVLLAGFLLIAIHERGSL